MKNKGNERGEKWRRSKREEGRGREYVDVAVVGAGSERKRAAENTKEKEKGSRTK